MDAPLRPHELLSLKRKHLNLENYPPYIQVPEDTKTGTRRVPIISSVPYLTNYLDTVKRMTPEDPLFLHEVWNEGKLPLTYDALRMMMKKAATRAGITKRVYPYLTRHSVITRNANKLTRSQQERISGWRPGSDMPAVYEHLSDSDIDDAILKANGMEPKDDAKSGPEVQKCPRCELINSPYQKYCGRCGSALDIKTSLEAQKQEPTMKEAVAEALKDPKAIEEIVHAYLMMQTKKRSKGV